MGKTIAVPSYRFLLQTGELQSRVLALKNLLHKCTVCPRNCAVNRPANEKGCCRTGRNAMVASFCVHRGEEPAISGTKGSGTIFFASCNLACVYCQNYEISQEWEDGKEEISAEFLAEIYLDLEAQGAHNINWVSPSHVVPQAAEALLIAARRGLSIPIVYNSNGYDSLDTLRLLEGIVDIYMPDMKYFGDEAGEDLSNVENYSFYARAAIKEMWRQVGALQFDDDGVAKRGLLVRHLVLPNGLAQSEKVIEFLAGEISPDVAVSLMSQYYPTHLAIDDRRLNRPITASEYQVVLDALLRSGISEGYTQELTSSETYRPDFKKDGHPFEQ